MRSEQTSGLPAAATTLVILLGASAWPGVPGMFRESRAYAQAAQGVQDYFLQQFGLPREQILRLFDTTRNALEIDHAICQHFDQFAGRAKDVIIYYIGHGHPTKDLADLYLPIRATQPHNPEATSLIFKNLATTVKEKALALRRFYILDCCFAERAMNNAQGAGASALFQTALADVEVLPHGYAGIFSSEKSTLSVLLPDKSGTFFTQALLDTLSQGHPGISRSLSFSEVHDLIKFRLKTLYESYARRYSSHIQRPPMPQIREGQISSLPLFPNPSHSRRATTSTSSPTGPTPSAPPKTARPEWSPPQRPASAPSSRTVPPDSRRSSREPFSAPTPNASPGANKPPHVSPAPGARKPPRFSPTSAVPPASRRSSRKRLSRVPLLIGVLVVSVLATTSLAAYLAFNQSRATATGSHWQVRQLPALGFKVILSGAAWGNRQFVAVGDHGTILTSLDGDRWTPQQSRTSTLLTNVTWGDQQFVAVGAGGTILTSLDSRTWTPQQSHTTEYLADVIWADQQFIAVGDQGTILTSPDGHAWTPQQSHTSADLTGVARSSLEYLIVGDMVILASPDSTNWTVSQADFHLSGVTWANNLFIMVGDADTILVTPDGFSFDRTTVDANNYDHFFRVAWSGRQFVAVGDKGAIFTSSAQGDNWVRQTSGTADTLYGVVWANKQFVTVGDGSVILTSPDGTTWNARQPHASEDLSAITGLGPHYAVVGQSGPFLTSDDGNTWTSYDSSATSNLGNLAGITWGNNQYVAVGTGGTALFSDSGSNWVATQSNTTQNLHGVASANSEFVAVGDRGTILTSVSEGGWSIQQSGTSENLYGVTWSGSQYVVVGDKGTILTSVNGITWTPQQSHTTQRLTSVIWTTRYQFIAVGDKGTILTSVDPDGTTWTVQQSHTTENLTGVADSGQQLIAVGDKGTILASHDAVAWTLQPSPTSKDLAGIIWANQWIVVGDGGTILTSA